MPWIRNLFLGVLGVSALSTQADTPKLQTSAEAAELYDLAAREAQFRAISAMPQVDVEYGAFGRVRKIEGHTGIFLPQRAQLQPGKKADELARRVQGLLMADAADTLVVVVAGRAPIGDGDFVFTEPTIADIPVIDARVNFVIGADGEVQTINSLFVPRGNAPTTPDISAQAAKAKLLEQIPEGATLDIQSEGSLAFWTNQGQEASPHLLWMFDATYSKDGESQLVRFGIDAATGEIRHSQSLSSHLNRSVYTNGYRSSATTPTTSALLWTEGSPGSDAQGLSMYNLVVHPIQTWYPGGHAFAYETVGLVAHYATTSDAFHIFGTDPGNKSYIFAGDQRALDADTIAHEYAHGMFGRIGNQPSAFAWGNDWFAGNEFFGDASAVITDIRRFGMTAASWQITDLRNWENPQSMGSLFNDWYPERYFANPLSPRYSNSTIFGHAVYLMIHGGLHHRHGVTTFAGTIPDIDVPAQSYLHIQKALSQGLYLIALRQQQFTAQNYKAVTIEAATTTFGTASGIPFTVERAWTAVGIGYNCSAPPPMPDPTVQTDYCRGRHTIAWPAIANAKYHGQIVAYPWPWDSLQAQDVIDGTMTSCRQNISTYSRFHMRACNACGCSAWTPDAWMEYWNTCQ